jgi:hypothetical protein
MIFAQQPPVDQNSAQAAAPAQNQTAQVEQQQPAARDAYGQTQPAAASTAAQTPRPAYGLPPEVTLKAQTFVAMRINQSVASNKNAVGDTFAGSLTQPVVVNGIVVAQRGQMVYGRVTLAEKVKGMSHLGVELSGITLADGTQATLHTHLVSRQGPMVYGHEQEGTITTTTGTGGAASVTVLATKGHASVIYPETALTFLTESPVTINTSNAAAYRYVSPDDYSHTLTTSVQRPAPRTVVYGAGYPYYPYPYWGWGPGFYGGFGFGGFRGGFRR